MIRVRKQIALQMYDTLIGRPLTQLQIKGAACSWDDFYLCGICQMMPRKVWPNTAFFKLQPSVNLHAQLQLNVLPRRDESSGKPFAVIESLIVYWPPFWIRTRAARFKIISGDDYTTTTLQLCTQISHNKVPNRRISIRRAFQRVTEPAVLVALITDLQTNDWIGHAVLPYIS